MVSLRRELVYSLLLAIGFLLVGVIGLLWVANTRERHYQDELSDLRRSLTLRNAEVRQLRQQLQQLTPITPTVDSAWTNGRTDTVTVIH